MSESITDHVSADESIDSTAILAVIGFGMLLSVMVVAYVGSTFSAGLSVQEAMLCKGACWAAFALAHFLAFRGFADALFTSIGSGWITLGITVCALPLFAVALAAGFGVGVPAALAGLCWALFGLAAGGFMLSWGTVWSTIGRHRAGGYTIAQQTAWALALGAVLCSFALFAPQQAAVAAMLVLMLASLALLRASHRRIAGLVEQDGRGAEGEPTALGTPGTPGAPVAQPAQRLLKRGMLTPLIRGIAFGIVFFFVIFGYPFPASLALVIGGIVVAGLVITLVLRKLKQVPKVPSVERATFPVLAAVLLLMPLTGPLATAALLVIALVALFYQFILNPDAVSLRREGAGAIYHCARENFVSIFGVLTGWIGQAALHFAGVPSGTALFALSLVLVFLMVVEPAFIPYMSYVALEELAANLDEEEGEGAGDDDADDRKAAGRWKQRCAAVCQEYGLSPRESEVFLLLAKGRNAEHISNELFISTHTTRTHMYRIYRKLSINSQQELIDLIDRG